MKEILKHLPRGWREKARDLGAMSRNSGAIRSPESLFRLNMLYCTNGGSFQMAATGLALTEGIAISKVAAFKRVRKSGEWLRWMGKGVCSNSRLSLPKPPFLGDRRVILVDASSEAAKGSKQSDYRLHYAFDLFNFACESMELTGIKEGEKLSRYSIDGNAIYVCDRVYCTISGMEHVLSHGGSFILRFKSKGFRLYDSSGERLELLPMLRHLEAFESASIPCFYRLPDGTLRPVRMVAMRKDARSISESERRMARKASRKQEKAVQADTAELNEYIVLATNLEYSCGEVLELYRARWQVEQLFFRLKSLFGYGDTPNMRDDTARAWFYGKLLLAAICESILKGMPFPPELGPVLANIAGAQFVERIVPGSKMGDVDRVGLLAKDKKPQSARWMLRPFRAEKKESLCPE